MKYFIMNNLGLGKIIGYLLGGDGRSLTMFVEITFVCLFLVLGLFFLIDLIEGMMNHRKLGEKKKNLHSLVVYLPPVESAPVESVFVDTHPVYCHFCHSLVVYLPPAESPLVYCHFCHSLVVYLPPVDILDEYCHFCHSLVVYLPPVESAPVASVFVDTYPVYCHPVDCHPVESFLVESFLLQLRTLLLRVLFFS
jgi:hypothetical protein